MPGQLSNIGRYQVESEIGRGGFGRVYKAFDPDVKRPVAIKILTEIDDPDLVERFQQEASSTGNLRHPNIVTIHEFGTHEGSPYLVMEYLDGEDLPQVASSLTLFQKVRIMIQVAEALAYAHGKGVVHRDVKPGNIRVLPDGNVKVMDFGIARLVESGADRRTRAGFLIGTLRYMAPEQLLEAHDADFQTDIFAYAETSYELLSGEHPFNSPDNRRLMYQVCNQDPADLAQVVPDCPPELARIVSRALAKDREVRYQTFTELGLDLQAVMLDLQNRRAAELLGKAHDLAKAEDLDSAQAVLLEVLSLEPGNRDARQLRERIQGSLRQMSVKARIESILKTADAQVGARQYGEAISVLESALRLSEDSAEVRARVEEVRRLQAMQEEAKPRPPAPQPAEEKTVLVQPVSGVSLPPVPEAPVPEPPGEVTRLFSQTVIERPLEGSLTIISCPDSFREGQTIAIEPSVFVIGRSEGELRLSEDATLSRRHASVAWIGGRYTIRDLGSQNGTYVNGRRLSPETDEPLPLNAEIRLSNSTRLRFRCEISELPDFTGQQLAGRYTLEKCLRAGRKSAFYEAFDSRPVRKVAVKLLSPTLATYPGYIEQFEHEAQTAAELNHPNICKIYEYGSAPLAFPPGGAKPVHYLCMQMLDGGSLASRMDSPEHTSPAAVADWMDVVAAALDDAHRNGVVHAGLKPTSIVFSATGMPYVTDFAIAIRRADAARSQPNQGAPEYLAPEQWEGLPAGPASDQYSLACLCYRVLTAAVPFENQLDPATRSRNYARGPVAADVRAAREGRPPLPPSLSGVLTKAMSVDPAHRFESVCEFAAAFRRCLGERAAAARAPRVFVSYRREADAGWAALFAEKLNRQHGIDVFVDRHRVDSARHVPEKIESAIHDCDFFVCLLARTTLESSWVREEIRIADTARKPMIPVVQEGFRRPAPSRYPAWLRRLFPCLEELPESARRLLDAEEVRLFADFDEAAIEKLARMILSVSSKA